MADVETTARINAMAIEGARKAIRVIEMLPVFDCQKKLQRSPAIVNEAYFVSPSPRCASPRVLPADAGRPPALSAGSVPERCARESGPIPDFQIPLSG